MRKYVLVVGCLLLTAFIASLLLQVIRAKVRQDLFGSLATPARSTPTPKLLSAHSIIERSSIFVPYWGLAGRAIDEKYDEYIYFGITATTSGIDTTDAGYSNLPVFIQKAPQGKELLLTLRMLDSKTNLTILEDSIIRKRVITETVGLASEYGFDGIVLDLELTSLPFDSVIKNINLFVKDLSQSSHEQGLMVSVAMYGDVFYRVRPFDVKTIAQYVDQMHIMAYDFHKARGNPGPNFPLRGRETYGYDMQQLADDFLAIIPPEKLTVIFGRYGYDWTVDEKGSATKNGKALTEVNIKKAFISQCSFSACQSSRDSESTETKVTYTDEENMPHVIWFEDTLSVNQKKEYLKTRGISTFSNWAYSYF